MCFFFFKQKTAYEMRISDWSSDVCSSDLNPVTGANYNLCIALTGRPYEDCRDRRTFKQFEPKVSLTYELSSEATVYASYGKGFKSGGFNPIGSREALIAAAADRKSTRQNSSHQCASRMPSSA